MKRKFEKIIVIGKGSILKSCLAIVQDAYPDAECGIFEPVKKSDLMEFLKDIKEETLAVSVMNPYIIAKEIVEKKNLTIINAHHALLPKYPGLNAVAWTIWGGETEGGISWHYVDSGIDSGKIIIEKSIPIDGRMTSGKLMQKSKKLIADGLREILPLDDEKEYVDQITEAGIPSDIKVHGPKDTINNAFLDMEWDFETASRFLRSMDFGPVHPMGIPKLSAENRIFGIASYTIHKELPAEKDHREKIEVSGDGRIARLNYDEGYIEVRLQLS